MIKRLALVIFACAISSSHVLAEGRRTVFTRDNQFPEIGAREIGATFRFTELENFGAGDDSTKAFEFMPSLRQRLRSDLIASVSLPAVYEDAADGRTHVGPGNLVVGLELLAFEDIFNYPFVIPYLQIGIDTGLDDLESVPHENSFTFGTSIGTKSYGWLTWIGDISYTVNSDSDNVIAFGASLVCEVSSQFSVLAELRVSDEEVGPENDTPINLLGGFVYDWSENLRTGFHAGGGVDSREEVMALFKASLTW